VSAPHVGEVLRVTLGQGDPPVVAGETTLAGPPALRFGAARCR
jgi:hypothetical protein